MKKLKWFHLTGLITLVLLMWKWMDLFLKKNNILRYWGWLSLLNWIGVLTLSLLLKLPPRKSETSFVLWSLFLLRLLIISINPLHAHAWNTVWAGAPSCYLKFLDNTKTYMQDCWSIICYLSWTIGSLSKCSQLKSLMQETGLTGSTSFFLREVYLLVW